jgi:hypothetical protein
MVIPMFSILIMVVFLRCYSTLLTCIIKVRCIQKLSTPIKLLSRTKCLAMQVFLKSNWLKPIFLFVFRFVWKLNGSFRLKTQSRPHIYEYAKRVQKGYCHSGTCWGVEKDDEWATSDGAQAQWQMDLDWGGGYYWSNMKHFSR